MMSAASKAMLWLGILGCVYELAQFVSSFVEALFAAWH